MTVFVSILLVWGSLRLLLAGVATRYDLLAIPPTEVKGQEPTLLTGLTDSHLLTTHLSFRHR